MSVPRQTTDYDIIRDCGDARGAHPARAKDTELFETFERSKIAFPVRGDASGSLGKRVRR